MRRLEVLTPAIMVVVLALAVFLNGCATVPLDYPRTPSYVLPVEKETTLGRKTQPRATEHPGMSGFYLLPTGEDSFMARILLADHAERSLDLQYYLFHADLTGKFLTDRIVAAAQRGVRVRLLLDDWELKGKMDWGLAMMQAQPNIEVRIFNPYGGVRSFSLSKPLRMAFGAKRLKGRMHNKAFIADNSVAIVGGRNIADEYFGASADFNFRDMDILAIGPVTREISAVFDQYWNSLLAIPIKAFVSRQPKAEDLEEGRRRLEASRASLKNSEYANKLEKAQLLKQLYTGQLPLIWAEGEVLYDDPLKSMKRSNPEGTLLMGRRLKSLIDGAQSEVLMISPYFVPRKVGVEWFKQLRARNVTIKVLTNSMASNDVPLAQGGYSRYRKQLLQTGVNLYELKPGADQAGSQEGAGRDVSSQRALHAKNLIVDRRLVFIGSFNLDPRSVRLDTQNGLLVRSSELADQMAMVFYQGISPQSAYRVELGKPASASEEWHGLVWITEENGREVRYFKDPKTGTWRRFKVWVLSPFAPESML